MHKPFLLDCVCFFVCLVAVLFIFSNAAVDMDDPSLPTRKTPNNANGLPPVKSISTSVSSTVQTKTSASTPLSTAFTSTPTPTPISTPNIVPPPTSTTPTAVANNGQPSALPVNGNQPLSIPSRPYPPPPPNSLPQLQVEEIPVPSPNAFNPGGGSSLEQPANAMLPLSFAPGLGLLQNQPIPPGTLLPPPTIDAPASPPVPLPMDSFGAEDLSDTKSGKNSDCSKSDKKKKKC